MIKAITIQLSLLTLLLGVSSIVDANLLISPTRVAFSERDRIQTVTLINSGKEEKTYRVEWTEQKVNPEGQYQVLSEEEYQDFPIASPFLRYTPRQVTLAPGEKQVIKVMARRAAEMADNEYRSHLSFTALPNTKQPATPNGGGLSMQLNMLMSYSIPVILRTSPVDATAEIEDIKFESNPSKSLNDIVVTLSRKGQTSLTGSLKAYYTPVGESNEINIGILNGFNFFPESSRLTKTLMWAEPINLTEGTLRVSYEGTKEFSGQILAEKKVLLR